jgi:hypothetical protein
MSTPSEQLVVKSHVARDLLQSAALFKTDKLAIWEYIANGLQYVEAGTSPIVRVTLDSKNKRATISDNGRGMDWNGLQNFWVMHGENEERAQGKGGRGRFGTGKSAALGIAQTLRVSTMRNGRRSRVEISRRDIEKIKSGEEIPLRVLEQEVPTDAPNGTLIEIEEIQLKHLDQAGIIAYVERHLARWPKGVTVWINNHQCQFNPPVAAHVYGIKPPAALRETLGEIELLLKVAQGPLDEAMRGVAIFANGAWLETTLAGSENREMAQYLFGEVEVPKLDDDTAPIPAFDMSRSMRLNTENAVVQALYAFISQSVEKIRRGLVEEEKQRRASAEAKKLDRQAREIARVLNDDFDTYRQRLALARARLKAGGGDAVLPGSPDEIDPNDLLFGDELPAEQVKPDGAADQSSNGKTSGKSGAAPAMNPQVEAASTPDAPLQGKSAPAPGEEKNKPRSRGGFGVKFEEMGESENRAHYVRDERTIYINLDHPQFVAARQTASLEDPLFRRLAYEVAFAEYSIALASELNDRSHYLDPSDAIVDIRETLNRVARKAAALYEAK